ILRHSRLIYYLTVPYKLTKFDSAINYHQLPSTVINEKFTPGSFLYASSNCGACKSVLVCFTATSSPNEYRGKYGISFLPLRKKSNLLLSSSGRCLLKV
ncbi:MAG: hypothetical protein AB4368_10650, partial [Xenococcaceae cyanobacterium]